ncbi:basic amino acid ABC transporter substrate-binding protein [Ferrimonas lipolytica]|uniref:Basic amino acid ABC transporter substrate-binding protein n=1 Tax=Ferrimonas lipolytica TaxID=2724191 RepID=A0A6H1UF32_9GAMM|nr:basic amino acid ABC transporter substrate-binding protein [Ferrimonas lipolytica]QIZ77705.1 basic amino acid ABC transporter substrate-binding protein [Ferrimonas lipolytica]
MKKTIAALSFSALALTGCGADKTNQLIVGTNATFPPFEYVGGANGTEIIGFDIDLAKQVAADAGKELVIKDMKFDSLVVALNAGKIDMIAAGMTITEERQANVDFSTPYYEATQLVISHHDVDFSSSEQLKGKKIAVQLGTTGDTMAKDFTTDVSAFNTGFEAVMELANGKVDAVLFDAAPAQNIIAGKPKLKASKVEFTPEYYGFAVAKGDHELLTQINSTLDNMKTDGRYQQLLSQYMK